MDNTLFDQLARRDDFEGFGYLGGRIAALDTTDPGIPDRSRLVAGADAAILAYAVDEGWDTERLFAFVNSKRGRWFADEAFGGHGVDRAMVQIIAWDTANQHDAS